MPHRLHSLLLSLALCATLAIMPSCTAEKMPPSWQNSLLPAGAKNAAAVSLLDASGAPRYRIVIPQNATSQERFAANELKVLLSIDGLASDVDAEKTTESPGFILSSK